MGMLSEKDHKIKLLGITTRRLKILESQAAQLGAICPPGIVAEIEDIKEAIRRMKQEIKRMIERELQLLKEKAAIYGISVDPSVIISIENLEEELLEFCEEK